MANFFIATAIYPDGHTETFEGRLWFLGGIKDEAGHAKLAELRRLKEEGVIVRLFISYES